MTKVQLNDDQQKALEMFLKFAADPNGWDMFLNGQAGVGKTTMLQEIVRRLILNKVPHVVCAYTHKAKDVLISKLPPEADVRTLHAFLKKRPGINENAKTTHHLQTTKQFGDPEPVKIVIVDEYSMVGEKDVLSLGELQDPDYEGVCQMKILWVGDYRQLPPVKDTFTLDPFNAKYTYTLKEVMRQDSGPLLDTICEVVDMIDKKTELHYLEPNEQFHRDIDIVEHYIKNNDEDKVVLAYTNQRVQALNKMIHEQIDTDDEGERWSPSLKAELLYSGKPDYIREIATYSGAIALDSKYKTLEHLISMSKEYDIKFASFYNEAEETTKVYAYVFGHYEYKLMHEMLAEAAAKANNLVPDNIPKSYCQKNPHCKECRARAKAWRDYLTFKECVICVDYPFAQTIHKSQGSTFKHVYVDNEDLKMLLRKGNTDTYLKLLYVAISRASDFVYMN